MDFSNISKIDHNIFNESYSSEFLFPKKNFLELTINHERENHNEINLTYLENNKNDYNDTIQFDEGNQNTNPNSFLQKKTKRDETKMEIENIESIKNENESYISENCSFFNCSLFENCKKLFITEVSDIIQREVQFIEIEKDIKHGRKPQIDKKNGNNGKHTKNDDDNKIRKIKSYFGKQYYLYLKSLFKDKELLKLDININKNLKRDYNLQLFKRTFKDIYSNTIISNKYKLKNVKTNEKLINETYNDNKQTEINKLLSLTYGEAFEIFRRKLNPNKKISKELKLKIKGTNILDSNKFKDVEALLKKIEEDGKKNGEKDEDIEQYKKDIIDLCNDFQNWFEDKIGRDRQSKK